MTDARFARALALVVALSVLVFGLWRGTWAAGGSDSSCYALMADAFARGALQPSSALAREAAWPDASRTFAPAGFIPSPTREGAASPVCAPGFSVLLAPFRWLGGRDGIFVVTPLFAALTVWLAFVVAARLAGSIAGLGAALLVAATPVFLFQAVQPMNDVTVTALWMAILASAFLPDPSRPWAMGALTGLAILVRPNLALSAVIVAAWLAGTTLRTRHASPALLSRHALAFVIASLPSVVVLFALNATLYGNPLQTGYGRAADLFAVSHVLPNLRHYGAALVATQRGIPLVGLVAPFLLPRPLRSVAWLAIATSVATIGVYLLYQTYDEWWYLRFLLPALAPLTTLAAVVVGLALCTDASLERTASPAGRVVAIVLMLAASIDGVHIARSRQAFDLQRLERRFRLTGDVARTRLPPNAIFISIWESGSLAHHADRQAILWDSLDPGSLDAALGWLVAHGLQPFIVVEQWEEPAFRDRFAPHSASGALDWPPRFDVDRQVRVFNPADRERYVAGDTIPTEQILKR
jgi:hypothetical protein